MKRKWRILLTVGAVVVLLLVLLVASLGSVIRTAVNAAGPKMLGVPVSVEDIDVNPLRGVVRLKQLAIGNPEGFSTPHLFELEGLRVDLSMRELLRGKKRVTLVSVEGPHVWYERKLTESNIGKLLEILAAKQPPAEKKPEEEKDKKEGAGVVIDRVVVKDGRIGLKFGVGGELPLPSIVLKDIGKDDPDGVSPVEAVQRIVTAILRSVTSVIADAGDLAVGGVKALGTGALEGGKLVGSGVTEGGKLVGEGVGAVGDQAGKAAKAVGGALKSVGGLLGGGDKEE